MLPACIVHKPFWLESRAESLFLSSTKSKATSHEINAYVRLGWRLILYGDLRFKVSTGDSVDAQFLKRHIKENLITLLLCSVGRPIPITNIFTLIESELPVLDSTRL